MKRWLLDMVMFLFVGISLAHGQGYLRFNEGNSLTGGLMNTGLWEQFTEDLGFPDDDEGAVGAAGTPIDAMWEMRRNNLMIDPPQSLESVLTTHSGFDICHVQPFGHKNRRDPLDEADAANQFYAAVLEDSPDCTLLVYFNWEGTPDGLSSIDEWKTNMHDFIDNHFWPIAEVCTYHFPDNPVYIIPSGLALLALQDSIEAGKLPRFGSVAEFYEGVHMNENGLYLNACVWMAALYQTNPLGAPHAYTLNRGIYGGPRTISLTADEAAVFQRTAWDVVSNYPRTLLSKTSRPKSDTEPPSAVTGLSVSNITKNSFDLSWSPSSDNAGVVEYLVFAYAEGKEWNSTFRIHGTADGTSGTIGQGGNGFVEPPIQPGTTYKVYVRARDALYNLSAVAETLTVTTASTVQGDPLKLDFGTGTSPVAAGYTEFITGEYYDAAKGYGYLNLATQSEEPVGTGGDLLGDGIRFIVSKDFLVDVDNGDYSVKVHFAQCGNCTENAAVVAEGTQMVDGLDVTQGPRQAEFTVTVEDGMLELRVETLDRPLARFVVAGIEVTPLGTAARGSTHAGHRSGLEFQLHPTSGVLGVSAPGVDNARCSILDLRGRSLLTKQASGQAVTFSTESLPSGAYIVDVRADGARMHRPLMIP